MNVRTLRSILPEMFIKMQALIIVVKCLLRVTIVSSEGNNACFNFEDYSNFRTSKNCFYDPDTALRTPDMIRKYAGKPEIYPVVTEDGYIVEVHRIPRKNPRGVVFMMHSLISDSKTFFLQGAASPALIFWRAGYDVWLGNQRGMLHSNRHVNLTIYDKAYWNFSFHEVGFYDMSAVMKLIHEKTGGSKIIFFGYSSGTTVGLVYAALRPEEARKYIDIFLYLSPACYYVTDRNVLDLMLPFPKSLKAITEQMCTNMETLVAASGLVLRFFPPLLKILAVDVCQYFVGGESEEVDAGFEFALLVAMSPDEYNYVTCHKELEPK